MEFSKVIKKFLRDNKNEENIMFIKKLVESKYPIYGLKMRQLENFVKTNIKNGLQFDDIDLASYEEIIMAGLFLHFCKLDAGEKIKKFENWINYVDNWSVCDMIASRFRREKALLDYADYFFGLLGSKNTYAQRFAIVFLMGKVLKQSPQKTIESILQVKNDDYYIKMAKSWAIAEVAIIDFDLAYSIIKKEKDKFIALKSISKCMDSFRVTHENKEALKRLRKEINATN